MCAMVNSLSLSLNKYNNLKIDIAVKIASVYLDIYVLLHLLDSFAIRLISCD